MLCREYQSDLCLGTITVAIVLKNKLGWLARLEAESSEENVVRIQVIIITIMTQTEKGTWQK